MKLKRMTPDVNPMTNVTVYEDLCERWPYNLLSDMSVVMGSADIIVTMIEFGMNITDLYKEISALSGLKQRIILSHYRDGKSIKDICETESINRVVYERYVNDVLSKIGNHIMKNNVISAVPQNMLNAEKHFSSQLLAYIAFPEEATELNIKAHISELDLKYTGLPTKAYNALARTGVFNVYQLSILNNDQIKMLPGAGPKTSALIISKRDECKELMEKLSMIDSILGK